MAFRLRRNVKIVPGRLRRTLENLANVGLWCGVIGFALIGGSLYVGSSTHFESHLGVGVALMLLLLAPYLGAEMLTSIAKTTRLVTCHRCDFSRTYPFRATQS